MGCYKPDNMKQKHDTQTNASYREIGYQSIQSGMSGVRWAQYKLHTMNIDSDYIDRTYDLFLWQTDRHIEIKTSIPRKASDSYYKYSFPFSIQQIQEKAFDYAICIGFNPDKTVDTVYIIPQPYIAERAKRVKSKKSYQLSILVNSVDDREANGHTTYHGVCNSYDKFKPCKEMWDVFNIKSKSWFGRKKNQLSKQLLNYEEDCIMKLKEQIIDLWGQGYESKDILEVMPISNVTLQKFKREMKLPAHNPQNLPPYTCDDCGKVFPKLHGYKRHKNRINPCKANEKQADWSKGKTPWNKGLKVKA